MTTANTDTIEVQCRRYLEGNSALIGTNDNVRPTLLGRDWAGNRFLRDAPTMDHDDHFVWLLSVADWMERQLEARNAAVCGIAGYGHAPDGREIAFYRTYDGDEFKFVGADILRRPGLPPHLGPWQDLADNAVDHALLGAAMIIGLEAAAGPQE